MTSDLPMGRREFLKVGASAAAGLTLTMKTSHSHAASATRPPNLLLIFMDELAFDAVGYANPLVRTPHIDALARRGMIFNAAHVGSMPCAPSRACMISGVHHHRWERVSKNPFEGFLREGNWTWAHALRSAGYDTGVFGALHGFPLRCRYGFDTMEMCDYGERKRLDSGDPRWRDDYHEWMKAQGLDERLLPGGKPALPNGVLDGWHWPHEVDKHPISWVRDRAAAHIAAKRKAGKPYLAYVSFRFPHSPFIPAEPYASMYKPETIPVPTDTWTDMQGYVPALDFSPTAGFNALAERPKPDAFRLLMAKYYGLVSQVDDAIGRIMSQVDLSDTLVLLATDHGDYCGRRGRIMKMPVVPFEAIARVPFVACGRGVPAGAVSEQPVSLLDIAPTYLRAAGIGVPRDLDGVPLQEYFANPKHGADRIIYTYGAHGIDSTQSGRLKYFRSHDRAQEMLFDLAVDPEEKRNIAGDPRHAEAKTRLAREMDRVLALPQSTLPRFDLA